MTITRINPNNYLLLSGGTVNGTLTMGDGSANRSVNTKASNITQSVAPSGSVYVQPSQTLDKNGNVIGHTEWWQQTDRALCTNFAAVRQKTNDATWTWYQCTMKVAVDGTVTYSIASPAAFRSAIDSNNASNLSSGTLPDARLSSSNAVATNNSTYVSGGSFDFYKRGRTVFLNYSITFKAFSGRQTVATIPSGYRPVDTAYSITTYDPHYIIFNTTGSIQTDTKTAGTYYGSACWVV